MPRRAPVHKPTSTRSASVRAGKHLHLYSTGRWKRLRMRYLAEHPLCAFCEAEGRTTLATVVDHITPHKGDEALFWDEGNLQGLCRPHHDSTKKVMEHGKPVRLIGPDGYPLP